MKNLYEKIDLAISMLLEIQEQLIVTEGADQTRRSNDIVRQIRIMAGRHNLTMSDIIAQDRRRSVSDVRKGIAYALYDNGFKKSEIALIMERDHSTVITMINHHKHLMKHDTEYQNMYKILTNEQQKALA